MSTLTQEQTRHIAKLARIALNDDEVPTLAAELSNILDMVEHLQEVNTDDVPAMTGGTTYPLPLREDVITEDNQQEAVLQNTSSEFGCFVVPKVIE